MKGGGVLVGVTVAALLLLIGLPLAFIVLEALFPGLARGSLAGFFSRVPDVLRDPDLIRLTVNTLLLGGAVVIGCTLIAVPLAVLRGLYRLPLAGLWDLLLLIPFMIPPYIATLGWIMTLQPRGYAEQLAGFHLGPFLFSFWGVVFVMVLNVFPVVYFAVSRTVEAVGNRFGDVARLSGAGPIQAFFRITLPLTAPGLAASLLLVFAMTVEEYGTPAALASQSGFNVLVTGVDTRISDYPIDLPGASIMSLVLLALSLGAFLLQFRILAGRRYDTIGGKPVAMERRPLGRATAPVLLLFAGVAFLCTVMPIFAIVATGFSNTISGGLSLDNLSFRHFQAILTTRGGGIAALVTSLSLGIGTALITGVLGTLVSYVSVWTKLRGRALLDALTLIPNAIPGVVVALGLILAWNQRWWPVTPYNTILILLVAYCCLLLPYPVRYANAAFLQIGENLEAAARIAGARPSAVLRRIFLPLLRSSIVSAMLLVFAVASRELVATILLVPPGTTTVSTFIWRQFEQGSVADGMAMAAIAIAITTTVPVLAILATRRMVSLG